MASGFVTWMVLAAAAVAAIAEIPEELRGVKNNDLFATWDHNGDGFISKSEVEKKGKQWSDIKDYDLNNDQKLSREEFSILEEIAKNGVKETNYFNHFRAADYNRDGFVTAGELKKRFKELSNKDYTLGQMENYIQSKDSNGDGKFNYYEFRKALFNV